MATAVGKVRERRRESPDVRRRQLIEATLKCIARRGISGMTLADVAREAGLSQGIVNLHFQSKDNLLNETLSHLADHYAATVEKGLAQAGPSARDRLLALIETDFKPANFNRQKIAVWYAFRGEAKSRATYRKICQTGDREYDEKLHGAVKDMFKLSGQSPKRARPVADALNAMIEGLWLSYLISPQDWNRERSLKSVFVFMESIFPGWFKARPDTQESS